MPRNDSAAPRLWILFGTATAVLALLILAWRFASGEWLWVILNGVLQGELK